MRDSRITIDLSRDEAKRLYVALEKAAFLAGEFVLEEEMKEVGKVDWFMARLAAAMKTQG